MPCDFKTEELRAELRAAQDEMDRWVDEQAAGLKSRRGKHEELVAQGNAQVQDLVEREKKLAVVAAELAKRLERERAELAELKEESQEAKELAERLPLQVAEAERAATQVKVEMEREAHALESEMAAKEASLGALREAVRLFGSRLGLRFAQTDRPLELRFIFTCVSAAEPEREFSFVLRTAEPSAAGAAPQYSVTDCAPPVARLHELLTELNRTSELRVFVKSMRSEFVALARV